MRPRIHAIGPLPLSRLFPCCGALCGIALLGWVTAPVAAELSTAAARCPTSFPVQPPTDPAQVRAEADRLSVLGESCQDRADYFAYQGVLLLSLKRPQQAALALEKALLLNPDLAGTQLDYAQALGEMGERDSAISLVGEVARRPDIPLPLQEWLADQLGAWEGNNWLVDWSMEILGGAESNLNSAPGIQFLTLTLPGGSVPVQLADSDRVAGGAVRTALLGSAARSVGSGLVLFSGEISTRNSPAASDTNQSIVSANAVFFHPLLDGQIGVRTGQTRLSIGGEPSYTSTGLGLIYQLPLQFAPTGCTTNLGYGFENRDFPLATYQGGRYAGPRAWLYCRSDLWEVNALLQDGQDRARDTDRLGGDQRRSDITLGLSRKLGANTLSLWAQRGRDTDQLGYSPLLGGQARSVDRLAARVTYEHFLADQWSIVGYMEKTLQKSNIELFRMQNEALYFGVRFRGK